MDIRILVVGAVLIAVGVIVSSIFSGFLTSGPLDVWNEARGIAQLGTIAAGIGVLMVIISFGLGRRKRDRGGGLYSQQGKPM